MKDLLLRKHPGPQRISADLYAFADTCNVYILRNGSEAVLVDYGSGAVLEHLAGLGITRVTDVLLTHHHRDQCQGLTLSAADGMRIWAPYTEQDLIARVDAHWQAREVYNNYNVRQDRFSLVEPVPLAGLLQDYEQRMFGGRRMQVLPTPGHTTGSITLLVEIDGLKAAFTGDLIAAPGKVWSMSATQWTYNGAEGAAASIASLLDIQDRHPDILLPSHGAPILEPIPAIELLVERLWELLQRRQQNPRLFQLREKPYVPITPHLLSHRASMANCYVLLSESGEALFIDFGYDFVVGIAAGSDRASRRPWLYTLPALKRQFGVQKVDVVIPTHYHDDHIAGCNLLREVEGTQVWAAESFADILENPAHYDLPCLWYDRIPVDRRITLGQPFQWQEYTLTLHPLPGHTRYAVAVEFCVDGKKVLATGDQYQDDDGRRWNYVYQNRYSLGDYTAGAELYRRIHPDLILSGHWQPLWVPEGYFERLVEEAVALERLQRDLLPESPDLGAEGFIARLQPYQTTAVAGSTLDFEVEIHNPFPQPERVVVQVVAPQGWEVRISSAVNNLPANAAQSVFFSVTPPAGLVARRARLAVDITVGGWRFGQQAEALVDLVRER